MLARRQANTIAMGSLSLLHHHPCVLRTERKRDFELLLLPFALFGRRGWGMRANLEISKRDMFPGHATITGISNRLTFKAERAIAAHNR
jgi:hypothetical protein